MDARAEPAPPPPPRPWAVALLVGLLTVYAATVGGLATARWRWFVTTWDLAIYDQATWLLAHGQGTFLTVRGLAIFEHHLNLVLLPLALLYRLVPGPLTLIISQVVAVMLATLPLFALARRLYRSDAAACGWVAVALAYPALQFVVLHDFHPDPLALPGLTTALWAAQQRRWRAFALACGWVLLVKEDAGLTVAALGLGLAGAGERRAGFVTLLAGLAYSLLATAAVMPRLRHGEPETFYFSLMYGSLGETPAQVALAPLLAPGKVLAALWRWREPNLLLVIGLLAPLAGLPLLKPSWAAGALASLYLNGVSDFWPTHELRYHYTCFASPCLLMAAIAGGAWLSERLEAAGARRSIALAAPLGAAFVGTVLLPLGWPGTFPASPTGPSRAPRQAAHFATVHPWAEEVHSALASLPPDAPVSASLGLLDKLSARREIWCFPAPMFSFPQHDPASRALFGRAAEELRAGLARRPVEYIAVETRAGNPVPLDGPSSAAALAELARSPHYELCADLGAVRLYRRRGPAG